MSGRRHAFYAASVAVLGLTVAAGCSNQTVRDMEGVPVEEPEKVELYVAPDRFPNAVAMCIHGEGFVSTTRDQSPAALQHIPEWSASRESGWCGQ